MATSTDPDGTDTQVLNISNQTVIAKKKGNKSIVAVKKTNKSTASPIDSDRELEDTVKQLKSNLTSSRSNQPKKKHKIKLRVNLTLDNKDLPFANLRKTLGDVVKPKGESSTAKVSDDSVQALKSMLSRGNVSINANTLNRELDNFKKMLDLIPEGLK